MVEDAGDHKNASFACGKQPIFRTVARRGFIMNVCNRYKIFMDELRHNRKPLDGRLIDRTVRLQEVRR